MFEGLSNRITAIRTDHALKQAWKRTLSGGGSMVVRFGDNPSIEINNHTTPEQAQEALKEMRLSRDLPMTLVMLRPDRTIRLECKVTPTQKE